MAYSDSQVARLQAAAPISYEMAQELASEFGVSPRSVVSKVISLGLEYTPKPKAEKKGRGVTKAQLVAQISERTGVEFKSLGNAATSDLEALLTLL